MLSALPSVDTLGSPGFQVQTAKRVRSQLLVFRQINAVHLLILYCSVMTH